MLSGDVHTFSIPKRASLYNLTFYFSAVHIFDLELHQSVVKENMVSVANLLW